MSDYQFVTNWLIEAPIDAVWDAIAKPESWPSWWKSVEQVELIRKGDEDGVGSIRKFVWKGRLPYKLIFEMQVTHVERPFSTKGIAKGELEGEGIWTLMQQDQKTAIRYDWRVKTTRWWMNLLAPVARSIFQWNHDYVMRLGGEGLARHLNARLIR